MQFQKHKWYCGISTAWQTSSKFVCAQGLQVTHKRFHFFPLLQVLISIHFVDYFQMNSMQGNGIYFCKLGENCFLDESEYMLFTLDFFCSVLQPFLTLSSSIELEISHRKESSKTGSMYENVTYSLDCLSFKLFLITIWLMRSKYFTKGLLLLKNRGLFHNSKF